ncbi:SMP-30/gluconolactonase/LRE family protein [Pontibacter sp. KCTC 32443]|uniref:SMP-30/gluconolactonase/LRE family protein n=1 Tax=Pontibacter TaxID=323449 RepID=UPI00164D9CBF|nr:MULTISPECIES: SMP-30/gluconolactonase/LRE family protein [Pontibacter]MBC5774821.1 SMP-30/gluconolactonase/LRE family protein [Pontibacter sp. KCTC 32443]
MRFILRYTFMLLILAALYGCGSVFTPRGPVELKQVWATDNTLRTPESVLHDPDRNVLYVSNINQNQERKDGDGFISKLNAEGKIEELFWVTGLNNPKGMALHNNVLYVADVDEVVTIAAETGAILGRYKAEKAEGLNDITIDNEGNIYITDKEEKRIYQMRNGRISTWLDKTKRENPNGIYFDGNRLVVAFTSSGEIRFLDLDSKEFTDLANKINNADGLTKAGTDGYFVSSWDGEVYYVNQEGKKWKVLDTKGKDINSADIHYSEQTQLLYIPTFRDNRVVAYSVTF